MPTVEELDELRRDTEIRICDVHVLLEAIITERNRLNDRYDEVYKVLEDLETTLYGCTVNIEDSE